MSARADPRGVLAAGLTGAVGAGLLAGSAPRLALLAALGLLLCTALVVDLAIGVAAFTVVSFSDVVEFGGSSVTAVKATGLLLVLAWIAAVAIHRDGAPPRSLLAAHPLLSLCAVLFLAWSALSATWAADSQTALAATGRYALCLALLPIVYAAVRELAHLHWIVVAFVAGAVLSSLYGALDARVADPGRVAGAVGDVNETAAVLVAAAAFALALAVRARRTPEWRLVALGAAIGSLAGLVATGSRGGLVALGVALLAGVAMAARRRGRALVATLALALVVVGWIAAMAPADTRQRLLSSDTTGRSTIWTMATRVIAAHPLSGVGADNFRLVSAAYLVRPGVTTRADLVVVTPKVAHSVYLETWAGLGIVGLGLFAALVAGSLGCALRGARLLGRAGRRGDELIARALVVAVAGMLAADVFISAVWSKQLWLLLALGPAQLAAARTHVGGAA